MYPPGPDRFRGEREEGLQTFVPGSRHGCSALPTARADPPSGATTGTNRPTISEDHGVRVHEKTGCMVVWRRGACSTQTMDQTPAGLCFG